MLGWPSSPSFRESPAALKSSDVSVVCHAASVDLRPVARKKRAREESSFFRHIFSLDHVLPLGNFVSVFCVGRASFSARWLMAALVRVRSRGVCGVLGRTKPRFCHSSLSQKP